MQQSLQFLSIIRASHRLKIVGALADFSFVVVKEVFPIVDGKFCLNSCLWCISLVVLYGLDLYAPKDIIVIDK